MNHPSVASSLVIKDLQSGVDYLAQLQLVNPVVAEQQLLAFLDALLDDPPDPGVLFALLEQARVSLCFVEEEMARRYHNRPLPLTEAEEACFQQVILAWEKMERAYARCASMEVPDIGNPQYSAMVATVLHRCIYYTGMIILEHYRARRELPPGIWLDLHGYYASAEEWGVAFLPIEDVLESNPHATHCAGAYSTLLLIELASPYSNSVRDLNLIRRWAGMWAPLVAIHTLDNEHQLPPYIVELMQDLPLHPTAISEDPGEDARRLDTSSLGLQISHTLNQLRQRIPPSRLGLGEETSGHVIQLLEHLSHPWTQSASPRRFRRYETRGTARGACGFEAMHYYVSGRPFEQPESANTYSRNDFDQLFTFRERADPGQALAIRPHADYFHDEWQVINHSASGFRLARDGAGQKLAHGQLMALCPHDGEHYLLVFASWLMQEATGGLIAGVATLPGLPLGIGVRHAGAEGSNADDRFVRAFLLPPLPAIRESGSLVLPSGFYRASGVLDVFGEGGASKVRMRHILHRGHDFDRVSYEAI